MVSIRTKKGTADIAVPFACKPERKRAGLYGFNSFCILYIILNLSFCQNRELKEYSCVRYNEGGENHRR